MYYVGNVLCDPNYLEHWGVLGMKWGVRRYQNPDGTLTAAGRARYGENGKYEYRSIGQKAAQWRSNRLNNKLQKQVDKMTAGQDEEGNKTLIGTRRDFQKIARFSEKSSNANSRLEAYKKRDADRLEYAKSISTGKAVASTMLLGMPYQRARSRGASRGRAFAESLLYGTGIGTALTLRGNKKKYGHYMAT